MKEIKNEAAMLQQLTNLRRQQVVDDQALTIKKKFVLALVAYAVLGVLAWTTLSDEPIRVWNANVRLRTGTLLILGLFAFRAALYFWRTRIEEEQERAKPAD
jgi:hypothetical protein